MSENDMLFNLYIEETQEHLYNINENLMKLEKDPGDEEAVNELFRSVHTIKGTTATMNYEKVADFIHKFEDIIQLVRDKKISIDIKLIQLFFLCNDTIENFLEELAKGNSEEAIVFNHIYDALSKISTIQKKVKKLNEYNNDVLKFIFSNNIKKSIENGVMNNKKIFAIKIEIEEKCFFIDVMAWMIFEEFEKIMDILISIPEKPSEEYFKNGFKMNAKDMVFFGLSELDSKGFENVLKDSNIEYSFLKILELKYINEVLQSKNLIFDKGLEICEIIFNNNEDEEYNDEIFVLSKDSRDKFYNEILESIKNAGIYYLDIKTDSNNNDLINELFKIFHKIKGISGFIGNDDIYEISDGIMKLIDIFIRGNSEFSNVAQKMLLKTIEVIKFICKNINNLSEKDENEINLHKQYIKSDMFSYINRLNNDRIKVNNYKDYSKMKLGEILIDKKIIDKKTLDNVVESQKTKHPDMKLGQLLVMESNVSLQDISDALKLQEDSKKAMKKSIISYVKVPEQKIDNLVDMMGELLIINSLMKEIISMENNSIISDTLNNNIGKMERVLKEVQSISMYFRMVSLKNTIQKTLRIGRDIERETNKKVEFTVSGDDTEVDKSTVENIQDALLHIVRNAVYHGIEYTNERIKNGKDEIGKVQIKAYNKKGNVYIEVSDDGRGIDTEVILKKAIEKGMANKGYDYDESTILKMILEPGFTTETNVNNISGRGVGMNVVENALKKIGGKLEIKNYKGKGCAFVIKIPVNMATINGTVIEILDYKYIIPTINVKKIFMPECEQWIKVKGNVEYIKNRQDIVEIIPIERILGVSNENEVAEQNLVSILEYENQNLALPIKSVIGKQEVVIKPLGSEFNHLKFVSGATILGDGKVSLILDIENLFEVTKNKKNELGMIKN